MSYHRNFWPYVPKVAAIALFVIAFGLRYISYLSPTEFWPLFAGLCVGLTSIVSLWIWRPSRLIIALIGIVTMKFPLLFETYRSAPSIGFWVLTIVLVSFLVVVTPSRSKGKSTST